MPNSHFAGVVPNNENSNASAGSQIRYSTTLAMMGFSMAFAKPAACSGIVALFTQLFAYRRLTKTGTTLWDTSTTAVVLHKKWGVFRALACTAAVFAVLILISALNAAGK